MPTVKTSPMVIASYEENMAINQSSLKEIMFNGIQSYLANKESLAKTEKYFEDKEHFLIGKAVDIIMSFGQEGFDATYHVSSAEEKPSDTMMKVLHMTLQKVEALSPSEIYPLGYEGYNSFIHDALNTVTTKGDKGETKVGYYMNRAKMDWLVDGRMNDVLGKKECIDYWKDMVQGRGKQVISSNEKAIIDLVTNSWLTHPHTSDLFIEDVNIIQIYQYPVYFMLDGVWCKGLIDKIDIDTEKKTITIFDLKTMRGFTLNFPRVIRSRRYDLQLSFYHRGLCQGLKALSDFTSLDVTDYTVTNPVCIVESTNNPGLPMQFELSDSLLLIGQRGDDRLSGYEQLLEEYQYWYSHNFDIQVACLRAETLGRLTVDSQFNLIKP
jgi:hypothetical protein